MPGPLDIRMPDFNDESTPWGIIRDQNQPQPDNRPHAPRPETHEDWRRYPENRRPGTADDGIIHPDDGNIDNENDGTITVDNIVWRMKTSALQTIDA